ncbi:MAG: T9SS type A sorting domain-containing protein [Bacteroidetes bacterium]|nr:T9SS type A sorting domain-containing protein [Bacteroidota bacterium]
MKIRLPLLFICIFLFFSDLNGQSIFIRTFGFGRMNEAAWIGQTADLGYAITGSTTGSWNEVPDMYLLRTDSSGTFLWSQLYGGNNIDQCKATLMTSDHGFILAGYTNSFNINNDYNGYLVRTDSIGNLLWSRTYGTSNWDLIESIAPTSDHGFITAGTSYGTSNGRPTGWILRLDSVGGIVWEKFLDSPFDLQLKNIIPVQDGNFVACGYFIDSNTSKDEAYAVKINASNGDTLWNYFYQGPEATRFHSITEYNSGSLGLCGYMLTAADTNRDELIFGLNSSGIKIFENPLHENGKTEGFNKIMYVNDTLFAAGSTSTFGSGNQDYHLMKFDTSGNFIYAANWGGNDDEICYSFVPTSDTGFALIGTTKSFGPTFQSIMLVKTNHALTTTNVVTINVPEISKENPFSIYPNPCSSLLTIFPNKLQNSTENYSIRIFSSAGILMKSISNKGESLQISTEEFPNGLYLLQVISMKGSTYNYRIIKED